MARPLAGLRIRERRLALGLTQAELARRAGISPSYLNLIEKNRRTVAGRVLLALARALDTPPGELSGLREATLAEELAEAAAAHGADPARAGEFAGRFPDWARAFAAAAREARALRAAVAALSDRLAHDPFLAESVHRMLTNVTAIGSTTEILAEGAEMPEGQRSRFLRILREESGRLAEVARGLAAYFDRAAADPAAPATPEEALDRFLDAHDHHFPALDADPSADPAPLLAHPLLDSAAARSLAASHLARYAADAGALPLEPFAAAGPGLRWDPLALARAFGAPPLRVFRRLAVLRRPGLEAPPFACLQIGAAGHVEMRRPLTGIPLPRHGSACPLWPVFEALSRPETPVARPCRLPDGTELLALALAVAAAPPDFAAPPRWRAAMLIAPLAEARAAGLALPGGPQVPAGPGCRLCPRTDCAARAGASVVG